VKYFHLKGWGNRRIAAELESTFQGSALSRATVKRWLRKFKNGDLSCLDENRSGRPLTILVPPKRHQVQSRLFHWYGASQSIQRKETNCEAQGSAEFSVHTDNSVCHNGAKITEKHKKRHIAQTPHPPYSPDLSLCNVRLFGILKQKMKERVFPGEGQVLTAITESWNELTFEDIQRSFHNCMEHLIWAIANTAEDYQS
jgi:hypothetical protein